jgi:hypothetical protein
MPAIQNSPAMGGVIARCSLHWADIAEEIYAD